MIHREFLRGAFLTHRNQVMFKQFNRAAMRFLVQAVIVAALLLGPAIILLLRYADGW